MNDRITPELAVVFGRLLATWRHVNDISGAAFAREAGLGDKHVVSRIENASVLITVGEYIRLSSIVGADASGSFEFAGYTITVTRTAVRM
jgi:hypothetical protein